MKTRNKVLAGTTLTVTLAVVGFMASPSATPPDAMPREAVARAEAAAELAVAPRAVPLVAAAAVPVAPASSFEAERALFGQAEELLFADPSKAIELLRVGDAQFPRGSLADQRQFLKLRARVNLNQIPEARVDATEYLELNPKSPIAADIHQLLGIHPPPEMGPPR